MVIVVKIKKMMKPTKNNLKTLKQNCSLMVLKKMEIK